MAKLRFFIYLIFSIAVDGLHDCVEFRIKSDDSVTTSQFLTQLIIQRYLSASSYGANVKDWLTAKPK